MNENKNEEPVLNIDKEAEVFSQNTMDMISEPKVQEIKMPEVTPSETQVQNKEEDEEKILREKELEEQRLRNIEESKRLEQNMKNSFIGQNHAKLNKRFNFSALLFGGIYFMYRKMYLVGIIIFVVQLYLMNLENESATIIHLSILLALGLLFNTIYDVYALRKTRKIISKNKDKNAYELTQICEKKGGTSMLFIPLTFVICIVFAIAVLGSAIISFVGNFAGEIIESIQNAQNGMYDGVLFYNTDAEIEKVFTLASPSEFYISEQYTYMYNYVYEDSKFTLAEVESFNSADDLINQMYMYYSDAESTVSSEYKTEINSIEWYYISVENSLGKTYYYATDYNGAVYLFTFEMRSSYSSYEAYRTSILNSIKYTS